MNSLGQWDLMGAALYGGVLSPRQCQLDWLFKSFTESRTLTQNRTHLDFGYESVKVYDTSPRVKADHFSFEVEKLLFDDANRNDLSG